MWTPRINNFTQLYCFVLLNTEILVPTKSTSFLVCFALGEIAILT